MKFPKIYSVNLNKYAVFCGFFFFFFDLVFFLLIEIFSLKFHFYCLGFYQEYMKTCFGVFRTLQTFKIENFAKIVNGLKSLTICPKAPS